MTIASDGNNTLRIAVAEDCGAERQFLVQLLQKIGHAVVSAVSDGEQLWNACRQIECDLAIVDLEMPVMDGLAVAEVLWQEKSLPIILISAHSDVELLNPEREPIACVLRKPISIDDLELAIAIALGKQSASEPPA